MSERLDIDTVLDNISRSGLYVRIPRRVEPGARLAVGIRFPANGTQELTARVAITGVVLRVESMSDGEYGLAIAITRHRIFRREEDSVSLAVPP